MFDWLLAQLVAPPLQQGPVRLPAQELDRTPPKQRSAPGVLLDGSKSPEPVTRPTEPFPGTTLQQPLTPAPEEVAELPRLEGSLPYAAPEIEAILAECRRIPDPGERLQSCAAALTARLVLDGYISTRVYVRSSSDHGVLEIVEGRLVELRVESEDPWLRRRVLRLLAGLRGEVLRVPRLERELQLLQLLPEVESVKASLSKLGADPSQASLRVSVERARQRWQGEFSLRNDGTSGTGEARLLGSLLKPDLVRDGDVLLLSGELNGTDDAEFGYALGSVSYTLPLADTVSLTGAFGSSTRELVEFESDLDSFSTNQLQGLAQLEWTFRETLSQRWSLSLGYSGVRGESFLDSDPLPSDVPEVLRNPRNGYLRLGMNASGFTSRLGWTGTTYLLQGVSAATPSDQRQELALADIRPGEARAWGALVAASWAMAPRLQLTASAGGQIAFQPLTDPMRFTLGSDVGLRGLPGQLVSGDSGWLSTAELAWTFWQNPHHSLQLVPFVGAGGIRTSIPGGRITDTVGSAGLLVRWQAEPAWVMELGWVDQFSTDDSDGPWNDWALGKGLYGRVQYRF